MRLMTRRDTSRWKGETMRVDLRVTPSLVHSFRGIGDGGESGARPSCPGDRSRRQSQQPDRSRVRSDDGGGESL